MSNLTINSASATSSSASGSAAASAGKGDFMTRLSEILYQLAENKGSEISDLADRQESLSKKRKDIHALRKRFREDAASGDSLHPDELRSIIADAKALGIGTTGLEDILSKADPVNRFWTKQARPELQAAIDKLLDKVEQEFDEAKEQISDDSAELSFKMQREFNKYGSYMSQASSTLTATRETNNKIRIA